MKKSDLPKVKLIIEDNEMFPSEYLDDMTGHYFSGETEEFWLVSESANECINGVAYCAPERMTDGTWNLLLIAVTKSQHNLGIGSKLMSYVEETLSSLSARILLVETSGLPEFQLTRKFYPKLGYKQIAVIPEYYEKGDDKVVFWKSLSPNNKTD